MNEIENIAERLEAALKKAGYYGDCFFRKTGKVCPQCDEFDAILRDLRGIKVVLPDLWPGEMLRLSCVPVFKGEKCCISLKFYGRNEQHISLQADTPTAAIAALAEKITKEKG